jgi:hypothetical protein
MTMAPAVAISGLSPNGRAASTARMPHLRADS